MPSHSSDLSPEYALLGFLYLNPMHGYDLHRILWVNLREVWHISQSQVYNILSRLQREGLVESSPQPQEKLPDRQLLSLSYHGKECFERWLYTPTRSSARALRVEFLTRMFFAGHVNEDLCSNLLQSQMEAIRQDKEMLAQRMTGIPPSQVYNHLGLELRIRQLDLILDWLVSCEAGYFLHINLPDRPCSF